MTTPNPGRRPASNEGGAWRAVQAAVIVFVIADALLNVWLWHQPVDLVLSAVSAGAVILTLFHPIPGVLLTLVPLISDILTGRDYGATPLLVVTIVVAARAHPRVAFVALTALAGIRAGHVWWSSGSSESYFLATLFLAALGGGLVLRWLLRHRIQSSQELTLLGERVRAVRQEERDSLARELSAILAGDLRATGDLLERAQVTGAGTTSLAEVDARARASLSRLRRLVSTLRGTPSEHRDAPSDLVSALEEVEDHLVGHGWTVEIDVPDPVTLPRTTHVDALLRILREATDRLGDDGRTRIVHLRLAAAGDEVVVGVGLREVDGVTQWLVEESVAESGHTSPAPADAPRRPFLTRVSLNAARLTLVMPATAAAGTWLVGVTLDWGGDLAVVMSDLVMVAAFLGLAVAAVSPGAAVVVLGSATLACVTLLTPSPGFSPLNLVGVFLVAVVAAAWPRAVAAVAVASALAVAWWHRDGGDPVSAAASVILLALGVAVGFGVRYFVRVRAQHVAEFERLTQAFEVARTAERTQLAGELHDIVAHQLSLMTMVLMTHGTTDDPDALTATRLRLVRLNAAAQADLATLVNLTRQEAPPDPEPRTTPGRAATATAETLRAAGHPVDLRVLEGADTADPTTQRTVSRILREATTNILRYAPAGSPVTMAITPSDTTLDVRVSSVLPPHPQPSADSTGFGLIGLSERAALTGATFTAGPEGGHWVVAATLPRTPDADPVAPRQSRLFTLRSAAADSD